MKKIIAAILLVVCVLALVACGPDKDPAKKSEGVMTYAEYVAAEMDANVVIEAYVQATQSWWDNKITVYAADPDGAYFLYEMACSEADAKLLVPGTKIKVTGVKGQWAGEVEVMKATFEFVNDGITYIADAKDLTNELGKDTLVNYQNQLATFKGLTVVAQKDGKAFNYQDGESGDIYFSAEINGVVVDFCVEQYLTAPGSDLYKAVEAIKVGDVIDVEAYLYWYEGANPHVIGITVK